MHTTPHTRRPSALLLRIATALVLSLGMIVAAPTPDAAAQGPGKKRGGKKRRGKKRGVHHKLRQKLVRPRMVIRHAEEIGLTDKQRNKLRDAIKRSQARQVDLQFEMEAQSQKLSKLLDAKDLDTKKIRKQADRVMKLEHQIKTNNLDLMLNVHNLLTPKQRTQLRTRADQMRMQREAQRDRRRKNFREMRRRSFKRDGGF